MLSASIMLNEAKPRRGLLRLLPDASGKPSLISIALLGS